MKTTECEISLFEKIGQWHPTTRLIIIDAMGIIVNHGVRQGLPSLMMSNGLTAVFIDVLALAMSSLAERDTEKRIAVWIASHDQEKVGLGVVDFDVCDVPWCRATFQSDKAFVLKSIHAATNKLEWRRLSYATNEESILKSLAVFLGLVEHFQEEDILPTSEWVWQFGDEPTNFEKCAKHGVYLHSYGCILCNAA